METAVAEKRKMKLKTSVVCRLSKSLRSVAKNPEHDFSNFEESIGDQDPLCKVYGLQGAVDVVDTCGNLWKTVVINF